MACSSAEDSSVYPSFGYRFCKHPPNLCTFLCLPAHICQETPEHTGFLSKLIIATTMCSYWSVRLSSFKSVHLISHSFVSSLNAALSLCSTRNKTGTDKKQKGWAIHFLKQVSYLHLIGRILFPGCYWKMLLYKTYYTTAAACFLVYFSALTFLKQQFTYRRA